MEKFSKTLKYVKLLHQGLKLTFYSTCETFASKIFSTSKLVKPLTNSKDMTESNLQAFASEYFSHLQIIRIIPVLRVLIFEPFICKFII